MPLMTRIPSDLAAFGLTVELVPGWETRSAGSFAPAGVTCHWTAGPKGTKGRPSLSVVTNGRAGLPGPLCNVYLGRDGTCVVVAAGRANHAGAGGYRGLVGNSAVYGIEAECAGDGDWTPAQKKVYPRLVAALLHGLGRDASWSMGHHEWAPTRKIDIRDIMQEVRSGAAAILSGSTPIEEDDMAGYSAGNDPYIQAMNGKLDLIAHGTIWTTQKIKGNDPDPDKTNFHWVGEVITSVVGAATEQILKAIQSGVQVDEADVRASIEAVATDAVAKAVADEQDRRERERLGAGEDKAADVTGG